MKRIILLSVFMLAVCLQTFSQRVFVATLKVDYNTYLFEGGDYTEYFCKGCDNTSLPFVIDYHSPGDFGSITFKLAPANDTIFHATIIWMGTGQIYYPKTFSLDHPFIRPGNSGSVPLPSAITWYDMDGTVSTDSILIKNAISAWHSIDTLLITRMFAAHPYQAAIYKYPPSVGVFNPDVAKWIVFLYLAGQHLTSDELSTAADFIVAPNPGGETVQVFCDNAALNQLDYVLADVSGRLVKSGVVNLPENAISISGLSTGMYILKLKDGQGSVLFTSKIIKR